MSLSLWIIPSPSDAAILEGAMKVLQRNTALSNTSYPAFHPHITLASLPTKLADHLDDVDAAIRNSILGKQKVKAPFHRVAIGDHYFRSVYIAIELTPELKALRHEVQSTLNLETESPLFPHLSLCYVSDEDAANGERQKFYDALSANGLKQEFTRSSGVDGVALKGPTEEGSVLDAIDIHEVWVVQSEGPVEDWLVLRKLPCKDMMTI